MNTTISTRWIRVYLPFTVPSTLCEINHQLSLWTLNLYPPFSLSLPSLINASSKSHFLNVDGNLSEAAGNEISQNTPQKQVSGSKWPVVKCLNCHPSHKDTSCPAKVYVTSISSCLTANVRSFCLCLHLPFLNIFPGKVDWKPFNLQIFPASYSSTCHKLSPGSRLERALSYCALFTQCQLMLWQ